MKGLLGTKIGMTQIYDEKGVVIPVSVIKAGPCRVIDHMTVEHNGYSAIQIGFGEKKGKNVSKAVQGHCKKNTQTDTFPKVIKEIRLAEDPTIKRGSIITVDSFIEKEYLVITGISKGRGFQGVVKRYNFAGGRYSHGGGWKRKPGSSGCREQPGNVIKGKKFPGHMGNKQCTTLNLKIVRIDKEDNLIFVKGAIAGPNGGFLIICSAKKKLLAKQGNKI